MNEKDISQTQVTRKISSVDKKDEEWDAKSILAHVSKALKDKGYNPVNQVVGYILSGDPTYITGHMNARNTISKIERDELLEEVVRSYLENV